MGRDAGGVGPHCPFHDQSHIRLDLVGSGLGPPEPHLLAHRKVGNQGEIRPIFGKILLKTPNKNTASHPVIEGLSHHSILPYKFKRIMGGPG